MILPVRNILVFAGLIAALSVSALRPVVVTGQRAIQPGATRPFEPSEELFYEAEFSRALLRKLDVADFRFSASPIVPAANRAARALTSPVSFRTCYRQSTLSECSRLRWESPLRFSSARVDAFIVFLSESSKKSE